MDETSRGHEVRDGCEMIRRLFMSLAKYRHELHTSWDPEQLANLLGQLRLLAAFVFRPLVTDEVDIDDATDQLDSYLDDCAVAMLQVALDKMF